MSNINVPGTAAGTNATQLQGRNVKNAAPSDGQVLKWVNASSDWEPGTPSAPAFHGALAQLTSNQSLGGGDHLIAWDSVVYDTDGFFSSGHFVMPAGFTKVLLFASFIMSGTTITAVFTEKNGSVAIPSALWENGTGQNGASIAAPAMVVTTGDALQVLLRLNGADTLTAGAFTYFGIQAVG